MVVELLRDVFGLRERSWKSERRDEMKRISSLAVVTGVTILLLALSSCQFKNTTMENEELIPALTVLDAEMIASKDEICSTVV